jgi:hypothetical protein
MNFTRSGPVALAATGGTYVFGGLAAALLVLVCCGVGVNLLSARRRRIDRLLVRRRAH